MSWAYLVRCSDGSLYAGWAADLEKRVAKHNEGTGAKYTRSRRPVALVWAQEFQDRQQAMVQEAKLKKMKKQQKETLVLAQPYHENKTE